MKKFTLLCIVMLCFVFSWQTYAQFTEDFEGGVPGAFTEVQDASAIAWAACGGTLGGQTCPITGTASATFFRASYTETITSLITPSMDLSAGGYILKFNHSQLTWSGDQNILQVDISTDGGVSWTLIEEFTASIATPTAELYLLDTYSTTANTQIRFTGKSYYGYSIVLDDVVVEPAPACTAAVVDSSTVVEDCDNSQFSVDVVVSDAGDAGLIDDGTNTYPVSNGTVTVGPFADGETVSLLMVHSDSACNFPIGDFTNTCPANQDTCATADLITAGTYTTTINQGTGGGQGDTFTTRDAAWYAFTAPGDGTIDISSCLGGADTRLYVFDSCGGSAIANNDDSCDLGDGDEYASEIIGLSVVSGTTYYIEWDDRWEAGPFDWTLTYTPPPACTAAVVDSSTVVPDCGNSQFSVDVVVSDAGDAGTVIDDGTNTYPVVAGTVTVGPYADGANVTLNVVHTDSACDFSLGDFTNTCPPPAPVNDDCAGALPLDCGVTVTGTTEGATVSGLDNSCGGFASTDGRDLFYTFNADGLSSYTVSLDQPTGSSGLDGVVFVYSGACGSLAYVDCSDSGNPEEVVLDAPAAGTYTVRIFDYSGTAEFTLDLTCTAPPTCTAAVVDSSTVVPDCDNSQFSVDVVVSDAGDAGTVIDDGTNTYPVVAGTVTVGPYADGANVTLNVVHTDSACDFSLGDFTNTCPPANDECADAEAIACGDTVMGSTMGASDSGGNLANDVWYELAGTANLEEVTVSLCGSTYDTYLRVYDSCGGTQLYFNDDASGICSPQSEITFTSDGSTYYIMVEGFSSNNGDYTLAVTCVPPPTCTPAVVDSSTVVPDCDNSQFSVDVVVSDAGDAGTVIDDGTNTYPVVAGTVTVGPYADGANITLNVVHTDSACDFSLGDYTYACPPVNDEIAGAIKLQNGDTMCDDPVIATNVGATDSAEGGASCGTPEGDVWFEIQIPSTGEITVETSSSGGISDTVMAIYSGASGSLVEVACSDDISYPSNAFSSITLTGYTPGDTYYIRVWEYDNDNFGTFSICAWSPSTLSVESNVFETFTYYPNPVSSVLTLKAQSAINNITVHNMLGQEVLRTSPNAVNSELDMSELQSGAYFVNVSIGDSIKTVRIIKN